MIACLGERTEDTDNIDMDYPGRYGILFQKAISAWWCGLCDQSIEILEDLQKNYSMSPEFKTLVTNHLRRSIAFRKKKDNTYEFSINEQKNTIWVVDNFYTKPDSVRKFALEQSFDEGGIGKGYIGRRTEKQYLFKGLKEKFEEIIGKKITKWEDHGMNGRFQVAWSGEPLVYHCDNQKWGGMIYLTPDAPYQCGTTLYAHKQTRARSFNDDGWDVAWKDVPGDPHLDGTSFEPVDVVGNVYNRLVIFDASCIHSASQYFGTVKENSRLWQMFFFDT
jgi:thiol-disulfide isomerase/thioredoxin